MRCTQCERDDTSGAVFCIYCGNPLTAVAPQTSNRSNEQGSGTGEGVIDAQIEEMTQVLTQLARRVSRLESRLDSSLRTPLEEPLEPTSSTSAQSPGITTATANVADQTETKIHP